MKTRIAKMVGITLLASLLLTACSDPYKPESNHGRGQDYQVAEAQVEAIEGVSDASFTVSEWYSPGEGGMFSSSGLDFYLKVTIEDGYRVKDHVKLLRFLSETIWSVNNNSPKGKINIEVIGGIDQNFHWETAIDEAYPDGASATVIGDRFYMNSVTYTKIYGDWPINPTQSDTSGMIERGETGVLKDDAIYETHFTHFDNDEGEFTQVRFYRKILDDGTIYTGDLTVRIYSDANKLECEETFIYEEFLPDGVTPRGDKTKVELKCIIAASDFTREGLHAVVTFEPQEGFITDEVPLKPSL